MFILFNTILKHYSRGVSLYKKKMASRLRSLFNVYFSDCFFSFGFYMRALCVEKGSEKKSQHGTRNTHNSSSLLQHGHPARLTANNCELLAVNHRLNSEDIAVTSGRNYRLWVALFERQDQRVEKGRNVTEKNEEKYERRSEQEKQFLRFRFISFCNHILWFYLYIFLLQKHWLSHFLGNGNNIFVQKEYGLCIRITKIINVDVKRVVYMYIFV